MSRDTSNDPDSKGSTGVEERLDRLESLVETQQETIQQQRERIEELDGETDADDTPLLTNRRNTLKAGGLLALLFGGVGTASADPQGQVGTSSDPLSALYTAELNGNITGDTALTNLTGTGLQIASESLAFDQSITPTWTGTHTYDTDGSANLNVDETGVYYSTANSETLNIQNSGDGSVTLQEDGTPVVTESRSLSSGNAVQSLGNLSDDLTVAVDATALSGNGLTDNNGSLGIDSGGVGTSELANDSVTVTTSDGLDGGGSVSLGGSTEIGMVDVETDTAATFTEGDVTVSRSGTVVSDGAIALPPTLTATRPGDNSTISDTTTRYGIQIRPNVDLAAVSVTISRNTSGSRVYLTDDSGNELTSDVSPGSGNDVTLTYSLDAGTTYFLIVDGEGDGYDMGYYDSASFPYESDVVDITSGVGINNGSIFDDASSANSIVEVTGEPSGSSATATATVEWSQPASVSRWETAAFQTDEDGETVEVYVETNDGSGWSDWRSQPIAPGTDLSSIPPDHRIRFRVELTTTDEANVPRVTLLSRQWRP